jgi:quinol monooxygenase YgiN
MKLQNRPRTTATERNMKTKQVMLLGLPLIASCLFLTTQRGYSEPADDRIVRLADLEIYPDQLDAYKAALKEEISTSIRVEPGVLTLYAVSVKDHPEQIRLFETYRNAAAYQAHLQSPHFKKYKEQTKQMVKSLTLLETDPILLGSKFK